MVPQIREGLQNVAEIGLASGARLQGRHFTMPQPPKIQSFYPGLKIAIFKPPPTNIVS